jgi:2-isopropylmalate synthase
MDVSPESLIHDWNGGNPEMPGTRAVSFADETLRDGLQSPSVREPALAEKIRILHLMESLGIQSVDIGLPGAGSNAAQQAERLAAEIVAHRMKLRPYCAARTFFADIRPILEISQKTGLAIEVATFIGTSPIRQYVEDWNLDRILTQSEGAIRFAVNEGLPVMFVTEDTVRTRPEVVGRIYSSAISWGARALVLCDTVGHATPAGARNLVRFVREEVVRRSGEDVRIDWHGHNDRGLGIINAVAAWEAGADQLHATALGIGERVGNVPMDLLLVNMRLLGYIAYDLSSLKEYCRTVSEATRIPIPINYPVFGADAFRTGTGVHAAAVIKAMRKGDEELSNLVYSGVPAHWVGLEQQIEIGPMCGRSNVEYWLQKRGIAADGDLVARIFERAKSSDHVLSEAEILSMIAEPATQG